MSRRNRNKKKKEKIQKKVQEYLVAERDLEFKEAEIEEEEKTIDVISTSTIDTTTRKLISKDIKMILITLLVLGLILAGVKVLQNQTDLIDKLGDWLIKVLNIRTS
jgi:hypothetical protein